MKKQIVPCVVTFDSLEMNGVPKMSSSYFRPFVEVYAVRKKELIYSSKDPEKKVAPQKANIADMEKAHHAHQDYRFEIPFITKKGNLMTIGDALVKVYHMGNLKKLAI